MSVFSGDLGGVGIAVETTYGVSATPSGNWLLTKPGASMGKQQNVDEVDALSVVKRRSRTRGKWGSGAFSFIPNYLDGENFRQLLKHCFGTETGTGPYTYSITDPSTAVSLSVWQDLGGYVEELLGAKARSIEFVFGAGFAMINVDVISQDVAHPTSVTIAYTDDATLIHSNDISLFTIAGVDYLSALKELSIKMDIPHTGEERIFLGNDTIGEPQRSGPRAISVAGQLELRDATPDVTTLIDLWEGNTNLGDLIVQATSGDYSLKVTADDLTCVGDPIPLDSGVAVWSWSAQANDMGCVWDETTP